MFHVIVVLSTFNGEKFLTSQLDSILHQQSVQVSLLIRDDGSTDGTKNILQRYAQNNDNVSVRYEHNVGVIKSFLDLLQHIPEQAEFIAFSDQDDIWQSDKLAIASKQLAQKQGAALYSSCYSAIDEYDQPLWQSSPPPRNISFSNAIVQNITTGCTIVFNRKLLELLKVHQLNSNHIIMHDWWVYLVATCFGDVYYDSTPLVNYRQHGGNVVGVKNGLEFWIGRARRYLNQRERRSRITQAKEFYHLFNAVLDEQHKTVLLDFINNASGLFIKRLVYAWRTRVFMQSKLDNLILKIQLIIGDVT